MTEEEKREHKRKIQMQNNKKRNEEHLRLRLENEKIGKFRRCRSYGARKGGVNEDISGNG